MIVNLSHVIMEVPAETPHLGTRVNAEIITSGGGVKHISRQVPILASCFSYSYIRWEAGEINNICSSASMLLTVMGIMVLGLGLGLA